MIFKCDQCGECCKNLKMADLYSDLDRGDGICKYLEKNNKCSIYEQRPLKCRVDDSYVVFEKIMTKEEYYKANYAMCEELKNRRD